jgi:hypothetical protein
VECRKESGVADDFPGTYKAIKSVIQAQIDLVSPRHRLRTLL